METYDLSKLTAAEFQSQKGERVVIQFAQNLSLPATIVAANQLGGYSPLERGPFSVEFQTTGQNSVYEQGIYKVLVQDGKSLDLFLVPIAQNPDGTRYEAIFS